MTTITRVSLSAGLLRRWIVPITLAASVAALSAVSGYALGATDALEAPAMESDQAAQSTLLDITRAGDRLVAVGERGHIVYSDDEGDTWRQAAVPVRVTLTAVDFPTPQQGWAVGHDGVILSSEDGGATWAKQLDGSALNPIVRTQLTSLLERVEQGSGGPEVAVSEEDLAFLVEDARRFEEEGPTRPLLDVSFWNEREGIAVGAYGLILRTRDGGRSWQSLMGRLDNPFGFHLYDVEHRADDLFVAGEAGSLFRSEDRGRSWEKLESPYEGTFFGLLAGKEPTFLIAYGLRGNAYRSADRGDQWEKIETDAGSSIEGATQLGSGQVLLVGHGGTVLVGQGETGDYAAHTLPGRQSLSDVLEARQGHLVIVGQGGARRIELTDFTAKVDGNDNETL